MRFNTVFRVYHCGNRTPVFSHPRASSSYSRYQSRPERSSFGIAFDIDGVILRGHAPIGGSPQALRRLYEDSGALKVPFLFLTNGGGIPESIRAIELTRLLGVNILPSQVVQGHTPFKNLLSRFENELIVATGKGQPALVMSGYGFKSVLSLEEVKAAFVVSDPVDWGSDIQVLCDILRSGGLPGGDYGRQPPLFFAADDLEYQAAFPSKRLGIGAFRIALECIFNRINHKPLRFVSYGKPNPFVFKNAEAILTQLHSSNGNNSGPSKTLYMIGDNPLVDIKGARQAGEPWVSILTRTGVYKGQENHSEFPADLVVDTVEEAVDYIMKKERSF